MTDFIFTHISARVPGPGHRFLINSYGVHFHEMRASDLVKIDLDGNVMEEGPAAREVNAAGFTIHSAVHGAREDLACVVHTHTAAGIAVSAQKQGLLPISQHALKYHGRIAYHGYEGVALDLDERERRSEEHTSELQSRQYLVCRLLLEKKTRFAAVLPDPPSSFIRTPPRSSSPHTFSSPRYPPSLSPILSPYYSFPPTSSHPSLPSQAL